jgi:hypothetical protein
MVTTPTAREHQLNRFGAQFYCMLVVGMTCLAVLLPFMLVARLRVPDRLGALALPAYALLCVLGSVVSVYASIPMTRLLLRLDPVRVAARHSVVAKGLQLLLEAALVLIFPVVIYSSLLGSPLLGLLAVLPYPPAASVQWAVGLLRFLCVCLPPVTLLLLPVILCLWVARDWRRICGRSFVLFLRRFSSRSDFFVTEPVLTGTPEGVPVVMLVEEAKPLP